MMTDAKNRSLLGKMLTNSLLQKKLMKYNKLFFFKYIICVDFDAHRGELTQKSSFEVFIFGICTTWIENGPMCLTKENKKV